jgi:hypothetical protein
MVQWDFCAVFSQARMLIHWEVPPILRLNVKIHLLTQRRLITLQLMNCHIFADLLPRNDLLIQDSRSAPLKDIALLLLASLVRLDVTSLQRSLVLRDDRNIDVGSGTQIVEDTSLDSV